MQCWELWVLCCIVGLQNLFILHNWNSRLLDHHLLVSPTPQPLITTIPLSASMSLATLVKVKVKSLSCVQLFATAWTVAYQAPLSMEFSRQEYWSGLPFPSPGDLPDPGTETRSPALQADTLPSEPPLDLKGSSYTLLWPERWNSLKAKTLRLQIQRPWSDS